MWGFAACALLLLPGIVIVRAPWRLVPLLSTAFWLVAWSATSVLPLSRTREVGPLLVGFLSLALLRLLRLDATRPAPATVAVALGAALPLSLLAVLPEGPGVLMPFFSAVARLLAWRDGVPLSYEPLLPFPHFVRAGFGLPALAADLGLMAHLPPARATLAVSLAGEGLLVLALDALLAARLPRGAAAAAALGVPALAHLFGVLPVPGSSPLALALALVCGSAACFWNGTTRSSAVAGALLALGALEADPAVVLAALPWLAAALARSRRTGDKEARSRADRSRAAAIAALVLGSPLAVRAGDLVAAVRASGGWEAVAGVGVVALTALVAASVEGVRAGLGPPSPLTRRSRGLAVAVVAALVAGAARTERHRAEEGLVATSDDRAALALLEAVAGPDEVLCHQGTGALWAPAMAGIGLADPRLPRAIAERAGTVRAWRCTLLYGDRGGAPPVGARLIVERGPVRVFRVSSQPLTSFDSRTGNLLVHTP